MLNAILRINGTRPLSKTQQSQIFGGIEKCCITRNLVDVINNNDTCNDRKACCKSRCACPKNKC